MFVTAGFIVGFDAEKGSISRPMAELVQDCSIPIAMVGLLYALHHTQLGRRLTLEGRIYAGSDTQHASGGGDHCTTGLNFDTLRPRNDILTDYRDILERVYDPVVFAERLKKLSDMLDRSKSRLHAPIGDKKQKFGNIETIHRIVTRLPEAREPLWDAFKYVAQDQPGRGTLHHGDDVDLSPCRPVLPQGDGQHRPADPQQRRAGAAEFADSGAFRARGRECVSPAREIDIVELRDPRAPNVLMVYPRFKAATFWNFEATCELSAPNIRRRRSA